MGNRTLEEVYLHGIEKDYLTKNVVPFADDDGGNYFCFDQDGKVYFYAMDVWDERLSSEENKRKALGLLAPSFGEFLASLGPVPEWDRLDE